MCADESIFAMERKKIIIADFIRTKTKTWLIYEDGVEIFWAALGILQASHGNTFFSYMSY